MKLINTRKCERVVSVCQASTCVLPGQKILEALVLCVTSGLAPDPSLISTSLYLHQELLKAREAWPSPASGWLGAHNQFARPPPPSAWTTAQSGRVSKLPRSGLHTVREAEGRVGGAQPQWPGLGGAAGSSRVSKTSRGAEREDWRSEATQPTAGTR